MYVYFHELSDKYLYIPLRRPNHCLLLIHHNFINSNASNRQKVVMTPFCCVGHGFISTQILPPNERPTKVVTTTPTNGHRITKAPHCCDIITQKVVQIRIFLIQLSLCLFSRSNCCVLQPFLHQFLMSYNGVVGRVRMARTPRK